jgi:uncharacterized protein YbcV (DUF1398 family)
VDEQIKSVCIECSRAADESRMTFPATLAKLASVGVEGYFADLRRSTKTYYLPNGDSIEVPCAKIEGPVALQFDPAAVKAEIVKAQQNVPGYTYKSFCERVMAAGCAGYVVSIPGRRVLYFGRTAETHVEMFP